MDMFRTPHLNPLEWLAAIITIVGALNWGLVGLFEFDLVAEIFGEEFGTTNAATRTIYVIVAASGLYLLFGLLREEAMTMREERDRALESGEGRRRRVA